MHIRFLALRWCGPALTVALLACATGEARAQFTVARYTIDGGGGTRSTGGTFTVDGTIGQPDAGLLSGSNFRLGGGFWFGGGNTATGIEGDPPATTQLAFRVHPAFPNPVAHRTVVAFDLPAPSYVRAALYSVSGRLVRVLADGWLPTGRHQRLWDRRDRSGQSVASGVYFLRLVAGTDQDHQKIVVVR